MPTITLPGLGEVQVSDEDAPRLAEMLSAGRADRDRLRQEAEKAIDHDTPEKAIEAIDAYLMRIDSFERMEALWISTFRAPPAVFWPVWLDWWDMCDGGAWRWRSAILQSFRERNAGTPATQFLNSNARAMYDSLPDRVTVMRGCRRALVRGLSWTLDRERAAFFARGGRFGQQPDPVIATAQIDKAAIFFVSVERDESEIILDPRRLRRLAVEPFKA